MYKEHRCFKYPEAGNNAIIWRYIDFTKFVSLMAWGKRNWKNPGWMIDLYIDSRRLSHIQQ